MQSISDFWQTKITSRYCDAKRVSNDSAKFKIGVGEYIFFHFKITEQCIISAQTMHKGFERRRMCLSETYSASTTDEWCLGRGS